MVCCMKLTTLCYIEKNDKYLMLHRVKKKNDQSQDKWLGVGGHFEEGESPEECVLREVTEETGLTLTEYRYRGLVTFVSDMWEDEYMHLFTATGYEGQMTECDEGELVWIPKDEVYNLNLWEGDKIFFRLLEEDKGFFTLKVKYEGDKLISSEIRTY